MYVKYPKNYFLVFLGLPSSECKKFSYYRRPPGSPVYWERIARKTYTCSLCGQIILKGERYIGCKKLNPGFPGIYGWRGTYVYSYYHIRCLLKSEERKLTSDLDNLTSRLKKLNSYYNKIVENLQSLKNLKIEFRKRTLTAHLLEPAQIQTYENNKLLKVLCPETVENETRIRRLQKQIDSINIEVNILREKIKFLKEQLVKARIEKEKSAFLRKINTLFRYYLVRHRISKNIHNAESQINNLSKQCHDYKREIVFAVKDSEQHLENKIKKLEDTKVSYKQEINNLKTRIRYLKSRLEECQKLISETEPNKNRTMRKRMILRRWRLPGKI